jgi:hypothetical protein
MRINITIPDTAQIVSGQHYAGWTWFTKLWNLRIVRYFYYSEDINGDHYQLVYFTKEEHFEQFKDDLEFIGDDRQAFAAALARQLPVGSVNNSGGIYRIRHQQEAD